MMKNPLGNNLPGRRVDELLGRIHACTLTSAQIRERAPGAIAAAAKLGLEEASDAHRSLVAAGVATGMHARMVAEALKNSLPLLTEPALRDLQERELSCPDGTAILSPKLVFHVLAGNLFLSGLESINHALLAGARSVVRCSSGDQHFAWAWVEVLSQVDAELARAVAVGYWPREDDHDTRTACAAADLVIAFGSDTSVGAIRNLTPLGARFIAHGSKLSFAILTSSEIEDAPEDLARRLAYDFSVYDQQGCLSPRAAFLQQCSPGAMAVFQNTLVHSMRQLIDQLPRRELALADRAALARAREEALINSAVGGDARLLSSPSDPFVVVQQPSSTYAPGCLDRFVDLRTFIDLGEVTSSLQPYRRYISTIGFAGATTGVGSLIESLAPSRVCPIGSMQLPPLGWTHDGRLPLRDLVSFATNELTTTIKQESDNCW